MYEYKVIKAKNIEKAEDIMNEYGKKGWRVVSTVYWMKWDYYLVITLERER